MASNIPWRSMPSPHINPTTIHLLLSASVFIAIFTWPIFLLATSFTLIHPRFSNLTIQDYEYDLITKQLAFLGQINGTMYSPLRNESRSEDREGVTLNDLLHKLTVIQGELEDLNDNQIAFQRNMTTMQEKLSRMRADQGKLFEHDSKLYYVYSASAMDWSEARLWCQTHRHGDLAQPTRDIDRFMKAAVVMDTEAIPDSANTMGLWLGASDREQEGTWKWVSGSQVSRSFQWGRGQPNNMRAGQDCMDVRYKKNVNPYINDYECDRPQHFICEEPSQ